MSLAPVLSGALPPGRYWLDGLATQLDPARLAGSRAEASRAGWACPEVDGARMPDLEAMFDAFAAALAFPSWFGRNWDAFADGLRDLSWLPAAGDAVLWQRSFAFEAAAPAAWWQSGVVIAEAIGARMEMGLAPLYVIYPRAVSESDGSRLRPVQ